MSRHNLTAVVVLAAFSSVISTAEQISLETVYVQGQCPYNVIVTEKNGDYSLPAAIVDTKIPVSLCEIP